MVVGTYSIVITLFAGQLDGCIDGEKPVHCQSRSYLRCLFTYMKFGALLISANIASVRYRDQYVRLQLSAITGSRSMFAKVREFIRRSSAKYIALSKIALACTSSSCEWHAMAVSNNAWTVKPLGGKLGISISFIASALRFDVVISGANNDPR